MSRNVIGMAGAGGDGIVSAGESLIAACGGALDVAVARRAVTQAVPRERMLDLLLQR